MAEGQRFVVVFRDAFDEQVLEIQDCPDLGLAILDAKRRAGGLGRANRELGEYYGVRVYPSGQIVYRAE